VTTFRAVILAAVSDPKQVRSSDGDDKESIPSQIAKARATIESRGWTEVAEALVVPGQSRSLNWLHEAIEQIPAYRKLRELADANLIDLVVVRSYDRLARTSTLQGQVSAYLKERGIQIFALEMSVEPQDPATWRPRSDSSRVWIEAIAGAQSESALNLLSNYHRFGMEGRTRKGQHAEGIAPYGYQDILDPTGYGKVPKRRVPDPERFPIVQRIFRMILDGKTSVYVCRWLNGDVDNPGGARSPIPTMRGSIWTPTTIASMLRNPVYGGKVSRYRSSINGKHTNSVNTVPSILVDGLHEPAVNWEEWQRANDLMTERGRFTPRLRRRDYLSSGLAVCGFCLDRGDPHAMRRCFDHQVNQDGRTRDYNYLICMRYSTSAGKLCERNKINTNDFCAAVVGWIRAAIADPRVIASAAAAETADPRAQLLSDLERVRLGLSGLAGEERRWDDAYRKGVLSIERFGQGLAELQERRQRADLELATLTTSLAGLTSAELQRARRDAALANLASMELDAQDGAVVAAIHQVLAQVQVRSGQLAFVPRG
jgi:DNA invertase Pin-like site-specific DNA recombinase